MTTISFPFGASATRRAPTVDELANGYGCGPADKELFDYLAWWLTGQVSTAISKSGLTVDDGLLPRLAEAMRSQKMNFFTATGSVNALVIAPDPAFGSSADLLGVPLRIFNVVASNTGPLTLNVPGVGVQSVRGLRGGVLVKDDWLVNTALDVIWLGPYFQSLTYLPSDALAAPYIGFSGDAVSQSFAPGVQALVSSYANVENKLPGATYAAGVLTIGTTGRYLVSANLDSLMPNGANYGYATSVSLINVSNAPILSIASQPVTVSTASYPASLAGGATAIRKLTAGDRIAAFFAQNSASSQNMSIRLEVKFEGQ